MHPLQWRHPLADHLINQFMQGNQLFGVNKIECLQANTVMSLAGSVTSSVLGMLASIAACNKYLVS